MWLPFDISLLVPQDALHLLQWSGRASRSKQEKSFHLGWHGSCGCASDLKQKPDTLKLVNRTKSLDLPGMKLPCLNLWSTISGLLKGEDHSKIQILYVEFSHVCKELGYCSGQSTSKSPRFISHYTSNLQPRISSLYPTSTLYTLNMAGKAKSKTKKTQLQRAEHDHVMDIAIAKYHADWYSGHLKQPRGLRGICDDVMEEWKKETGGK